MRKDSGESIARTIEFLLSFSGSLAETKKPFDIWQKGWLLDKKDFEDLSILLTKYGRN